MVLKAKHALSITALTKLENTRKRYYSDTGYYWDVGKKGSGLRIFVPSGDVFNFDVSSPRILEWYFNPHDINHLVAAGIHDRLLEEGFDAAFASSEFRRVLRGRGVRAQKAWLAFFGTLIVTAFKGRRVDIPS